MMNNDLMESLDIGQFGFLLQQFNVVTINSNAAFSAPCMGIQKNPQ
jgi:hypothetical protein